MAKELGIETHGNAKAFGAAWTPRGGVELAPVLALGLRDTCAAALEGVDGLGVRGVDKIAARARVALATAPNGAVLKVRELGALRVWRAPEHTEALHLARLNARGAADDERLTLYRARLRIFDERAGVDRSQSEALAIDGRYAATESEASHLISARGLLNLMQAAANKAGAIHAARDGAAWPSPPHCFTFEELARRVPHIRSQISRTPNGTSVAFPMRGELYGRDGEERFRAYLDFGPHVDAMHETSEAPSLRAGFKRRQGNEAE